ncbi:MAG TPA: 5-formyltetrahydrofolate cyclo-ligase [Azospira sp.]|nr:5-formyltetrahydrofolate cyclo-ligase [Azospira sp.]
MTASPFSPPPAPENRRALRQRLIESRLALSAEAVALLSEAVCGHLLAGFPELATKVVGFCWPVQNEPDLRPLLETWLDLGGRAALPVVTVANAPLAFREWTPATPLAPDRYGIPTPTRGNWLVPEVLLLPVNGVDRLGYRLGYGGGFFDRTLASLDPRPLAIGVGYEMAKVADIGPEPHDEPLDALVTEAGITHFKP